MPGFESDEEEEPEDLMAMEGSDGQQYVVLEVIQLADGDEQMADDSETELITSSILPNSGKINSLTPHLKFARLKSYRFLWRFGRRRYQGPSIGEENNESRRRGKGASHRHAELLRI